MTDWHDIVLRLGSAAIMGGIIGLNRNLHGKPSGLRTVSVVGLGAATMVMLAGGDGGDPAAVSRVLQGLLTGIGFLGAGVILHQGSDHKVHGLTTAATIWVNAAVGMAAGSGEFTIAGIATAITLVVLVVLPPIEGFFERRTGVDFHHEADQ